MKLIPVLLPEGEVPDGSDEDFWDDDDDEWFLNYVNGKTEEKHLPNKHDQSTHGRGGAAYSKTKVDLDAIKDPAIRGRVQQSFDRLMADYPMMDGYLDAFKAAPTRAGQVGVTAAGDEIGKLEIRLDPAFMNEKQTAFLAESAGKGDYHPGWQADPIDAIVTHEFGHALRDLALEPWRNHTTSRENENWLYDTFTGDLPEGKGEYAKTNQSEGWAEAFSETRTTPRDQWSPAAQKVDGMVTEARKRGLL